VSPPGRMPVAWTRCSVHAEYAKDEEQCRAEQRAHRQRQHPEHNIAYGVLMDARPVGDKVTWRDGVSGRRSRSSEANDPP
jgi:hypothetical protein